MKRKRGPKREKVHLLFDEEERSEYLTGFHKRKEARKAKLKQDLEVWMKEEKQKIRREQKDALRTALLSQRRVPEVEHLIEPITYDLPGHTVTISEIGNLDSIPFTAELENETEKLSQDEDLEKEAKEIERIKKMVKELKSKRVQALKGSAVFNAQKTLQKKIDKKKSKKLKIQLKKNARHTKKNKCKKKRGK